MNDSDDTPSLNSAPTMFGSGARRSAEPYDESSLGSAPTMAPGGPGAVPAASSLGRIDQYDLVSKLGGGGFGVVYLARDTVSGVEVALKTLHPLLKSNAEEMERLREKFALVARLTHQNIAKALVLHPVRDIAIADDEARRELRLFPGDFVMVMDYAPGVTLSKWRRQFPDSKVPLDQALEIGRQIAAALDYAHGERIVHRDIKPSNVMVETLAASSAGADDAAMQNAECRMQNGGAGGGTPLATDHWPLATSKIRVRILDFGLAAEIRSSMSRVSSETGDTSGTRPYMAPEQWLGKKQDGRTDQYALACVLYELLSGEPPFAGVFETGDPAIMKDAVVRDVPDEIDDVPPAVNAALLKALSKTPNERFSSCVEFVAAMSNADSATPWERGHPARGTSGAPKRRILWPWLLAGAAAVALGVGLWRTGGTSGTGATGDESTPPVTQVPSTPSPKPQVPPDPPIAPDQPSGGPTAVLAATSGGIATATSATAIAVPSGGVTAETSAAPAAVPILPSATATRAELEDALAQLESRRDALASQGYAAGDPERKPVEEALATLRSRIDTALEEETRKAREAELAGRRAAAQRTIDLRSLSDLKKAVERRVSSLDGTWTDGEFARRRKAIADAQRELAGCTEATSLARAKELRGDIYDAVDWIERNTPARAGLADTEKSLDGLVRDCATADAARFAAAALRKAERARKEAEAKRDSGRYEEAAVGYASAKTLFEAALAEARAAKAAALVVEARAFGESKLWDKCLRSAEKALEWDASNADAKHLKEEAERNLKPIWVVSATLDGKEVSGAQLTLGKQSYSLSPSKRLSVATGSTYGPGEVTFEKDGKKYSGTLARVTVGDDWKGERKAVVVLEECRGPKPGEHAGERKVVRIGSQEIALRWCPPGTFTMGSPTSEEGRRDDEVQHRVALSQGFWMGETEVTQGLWKEVMGTNPSHFKSGDNYPVENVSWSDCQKFLSELNSRSEVRKTGLKFSLPTEAQWEYACRAGTTTSFGVTGIFDHMGWYSENSENKTHPVARKKANAWGLHDMHGNVWEWCQDWYGNYLGEVQTDPSGVHFGSYRVIRGGSCWNDAQFCRSANRDRYRPDSNVVNYGFRLLALKDAP